MKERLETCMIERDKDGDVMIARGSSRMFIAHNEIDKVITFLTKVKEENERELSVRKT